ncbi:MAG: YihA family ribosome biogenesis GTP-binding protein [Myxococcales bacterium]|nr:YihA family ribosome biogenesis GTP-binding protein [Myxococcales bacterium]
MHILRSEFVASAPTRAQWPAPTMAEVAICGRSNVGKSTLLNALLGRRGLARVSKTPGRTRLINFFRTTVSGPEQPIDVMLADLPGYGYAEVSRTERASWQKMMEEYLSGRDSLRAVAMLCDARRVIDARVEELLFDESELALYLRGLGRKVIPVLTKADKLAKSERKPAAQILSRVLGGKAIVCAAEQGEGIGELWQRLLLSAQDRGTESGASLEDRV